MSEKAKWCYVNLLLETVAMENKQQRVTTEQDARLSMA